MEITQKDRDALRHAQQTIAQPYIIGNLIEHKIQDPAKYKTLSRQEQGLDPDAVLEPPKIEYKSKYFDCDDSVQPVLDSRTCKTRDDEKLVVAEPLCDRNLPITSNDVQANSWLNMDRIEFDKLEWMTERAEKLYCDKLQSTTHFDFEGRAIEPNEFIKYSEACHPTSDGDKEKETNLIGRFHDIGSLVKYLDSQFQPQVNYALGVISKISNRATTGYYDGTFDENVHEILIKDCLLRVRRHIDSSNETICQNALRCLRSLLCNTQVDEIFLDRMHPILNDKINETIWLNNDGLSSEFDIDVDDNHCVQIDAILALIIRTNLLPRLMYLIMTKQDKFADNYNDCILDILIRIARHSRGVCLLMGDSGLVKLVIEHYLPIDVARSKPIAQSMVIRALKFIRILAQATRELKIKHEGSGKILIPETILERLESYYHIESDVFQVEENSMLFKVHIETLRLMKVLMFLKNFAKHIHSIVIMSPNSLLMLFQIMGRKLRSVQIVESRISCDWQFAAHIIDLVGHLLHYETYYMKNSTIYSIWSSYIQPITLQWLNDIIRERFIPHLDISIAIAISVSHFPKNSKTQERQTLINVLLSNTNKHKDMKENASLLYFKLLISEAETKSQFEDMLERDGRLRDPKMLNSYGCLDYNSTTSHIYKLNPTIENDSTIVLLNMFTSSMYQNQSIAGDLICHYANNINTVRYLRRVCTYFKQPKTYESFAQRSLLVQQEVSNMIRLMLLQVGHYMERKREDIVSYDPEPEDIKNTKRESYSNLILSAISIIGLVNSQTDDIVELKDKLLEATVLNNDLHKRLAKDIYRNKPTNKQFDLAYYNEFGLDIFRDRAFTILDEQDSFMLKYLYMNVEQPGRFWIFQPIVEYYDSQLKNRTNSEKSDRRWFSKGTQLAHDDFEVVTSILNLHAALMHTSPAYNHFVLRPNIEEFICLIGIIFLDDDLFLDQKISEALNLNLELMVAECIDKRRVFTDASKIIETLDLPLYEFFNKLVEQYESCSYGDTVFTNYLLLFIAAKSDKSFKRKLFSEKVETCVSQMRIPTEQVWASVSLMFRHLENDPEILNLIERAEKNVRPGSFMFTYRRKQLSQRKQS